MFQPQATPFSIFSSYGTGGSVSAGDFPAFQPVGGGDGGGTLMVEASPALFRETVFSPVVASNNTSLRTRSIVHDSTTHPHIPSQQYNKMTAHDMEAQELAARDYERDRKFEGAMVGEKKSSHAITEEYAKADPIYVAKTAALPQKYSHYRPILGDGNCGWRAVAFSYYEYLLRSQSRATLEEEMARIMSLNNLLTTAGGYDTWLFEDMVEQTTDLLRDLSEVVETSPELAANMLLERFNQPDTLSIIYHMRLLASANLASNAASYQGFMQDGLSVDEYRKTFLETVNTEIEHMGLSLLIDVLLSPIGVAVEIVYLDRSEGSQANSHIFQSQNANGLPTNPGGPIIHLLYRPSHYDILYRETPSLPDRPLETATRNSNIQVNRATSLSHQRFQQSTSAMGDFSQLDLTTLLSLPGYSMPPQPSHMGYQSQYQPPVEQSYSHSPMSASISPISPGASVATTSSTTTLPQSYPSQQPAPQQNHPSPNTPISNHGLQSFPRPTTQLPIHTQVPLHNPNVHRSSISHTPMASELSSPSCAPTSFRPSVYEYTAAAEHEPVVFQTNTFKNSHYNTAHYNNPNFQPEEWTPESEDPPTSRKKSTAS